MEQMKPMQPMRPMKPMAPVERWWPEDLGEPSTSGGQNIIRYAFFSAERRLLIESHGELAAYDTGDHEIKGVFQQHNGEESLSFTSQTGRVNLSELKRL